MHGGILNENKVSICLVSSKEDLYWEQCLISVMSARYQMPQAQIYLVCDDQTNDSLRGIREEIKQFITKLIVIPLIIMLKNSDDHAY